MFKQIDIVRRTNAEEFTVWINCSSDFKKISNSRPSASNFKSISWLLKQLFLIVGQNNLVTKYNFGEIKIMKLWLLQYNLLPIYKNTTQLLYYYILLNLILMWWYYSSLITYIDVWSMTFMVELKILDGKWVSASWKDWRWV